MFTVHAPAVTVDDRGRAFVLAVDSARTGNLNFAKVAFHRLDDRLRVQGADAQLLNALGRTEIARVVTVVVVVVHSEPLGLIFLPFENSGQ